MNQTGLLAVATAGLLLPMERAWELLLRVAHEGKRLELSLTEHVGR